MNGKIRTLMFLGFTALAATATGCIIEDSSSGGGCFASRYVDVAWNIQQTPTSSQFISCSQAGADSVELDFGSNQYNFPCSVGEDTTQGGLAEGPYTTQLKLLASDNTVLSQASQATFTVQHCAPTIIPTVDFSLQ